jgi:Flp pilus assembly pilin Flp
MTFDGNELLALAIAISFAAGLNVSAVLVTLGLLSQAGVLVLPTPIAIVGQWWVIGVGGALFLLESFGDKIPAFDLIWNALLTVIRVPAGALLAFAATDALSPGMQLAAAAGGGAVTFAAHGAKTALRGSIAASPEPFSNIGLSLIDDVVAVGLTWFAVEHPYLAAAIALVLVAAAVLVIRWILLALRALFRGAARQIGTPHGVPPAR